MATHGQHLQPESAADQRTAWMRISEEARHAEPAQVWIHVEDWHFRRTARWRDWQIIGSFRATCGRCRVQRHRASNRRSRRRRTQLTNMRPMLTMIGTSTWRSPTTPGFAGPLASNRLCHARKCFDSATISAAGSSPLGREALSYRSSSNTHRDDAVGMHRLRPQRWRSRPRREASSSTDLRGGPAPVTIPYPYRCLLRRLARYAPCSTCRR